MHLIPVSIEIIKNDSNLKGIQKTVDITMYIEVRGYGDFSEYVTNNEIDAAKIAVGILEGRLTISSFFA